ncbi:MAG: hypothetical protein A3J24_01575 [Deltaproteobacteria bacterium RIFCSPLOWO2_02_FULL_53_8]|nr:MAG: hypothetical protein A3J24_01575 [Deltaproteobacteria bacterium RIFCSPLOWO2_02_FULL_53_8]
MSEDKINVEYQPYLIIFLDILGQKELLRQMAEYPTNENERERFKTLSSETLEKVIYAKNLFANFVDAHMKKPISPLQTALGYQRAEIIFYGISDSLIIAVPLGTEQNPTAIYGVFATLMATCGLGLAMLSKKIAIRGGLDVSMATRIETNEIYGWAVASAHHIENKLAEYPRFVIGNGLRSYLKTVENHKPSFPIGENNISLAKTCQEMIIQDNDGHYMLDFLGETLKKYLKTYYHDFSMKAYTFVKGEHERFVKENNHKLALRYYRLLTYFESRRSLWE